MWGGQKQNLNVGRLIRLTVAGGHKERREANQLMQPIKLPLPTIAPPTHPPPSLSKHFKVLPSANGNRVNELAVNGCGCWECWGRGLSNDAHHTDKTMFPCCKSKMGVQRLPHRGNKAHYVWLRQQIQQKTAAYSADGHFCWWPMGSVAVFVSAVKGKLHY